METQINLLLNCICAKIKRRPSNRKSIQSNYDLIYKVLKKNGYNDFVAHHWSLSTLAKIYGSIAVTNAVSYNN